jgi:CPA2 family monovalent cation:H+ antiporter-2
VTALTKFGTGYVAARRAKVKRRGRWRAGLELIPRGEFSVVIAALAVGAGVDARLGPLTAAYVLLTIVLAAAVQKLPDRLAATRERRLRRPQVADEPKEPALGAS